MTWGKGAINCDYEKKKRFGELAKGRFQAIFGNFANIAL
jgi:hypothetical protein